MKKVLIVLITLMTTVSATKVRAQSEILDIAPAIQETYVWCWAATAEMVFTHYGLPNLNPGGDFQCGIVAAYFGSGTSCWSNCYSCATGIGVMSNEKRLFDRYGIVANQMGIPSDHLSTELLFRPLTFEEVKTEIDNSRPVLAGISPGGYSQPDASQHVCVIIGYSEDEGEQYLIVNDPFPFWHADFSGANNPYLAHGSSPDMGQYIIPYNAFRNRLTWANTLYRIAAN